MSWSFCRSVLRFQIGELHQSIADAKMTLSGKPLTRIGLWKTLYPVATKASAEKIGTAFQPMATAPEFFCLISRRRPRDPSNHPLGLTTVSQKQRSIPHRPRLPTSEKHRSVPPTRENRVKTVRKPWSKTSAPDFPAPPEAPTLSSPSHLQPTRTPTRGRQTTPDRPQSQKSLKQHLSFSSTV